MSWTVAHCEECHGLNWEPLQLSEELLIEFTQGWLRKNPGEKIPEWPRFFARCPICGVIRIFRGIGDLSDW